MSALTEAVNAILSTAGSLITSLFSPGTENVPAVLAYVAAIPILSGVIGIVVSATRKGKG